MKNSISKTELYEQVARIGKALASPKRLEMIELLTQSEKSVEALAGLVGIDKRLASSHLKELRSAHLVTSRREGKYIIYRLTGLDVPQLLVALRNTAEEHLFELQIALKNMVSQPESFISVSRESLLEKARQGDVIVIDVRPPDEFKAGHLPFARSMPLEEIESRLADLPNDRVIVAYCRGPYCFMSDQAIAILKAKGYQIHKIMDGINEWKMAGFPIEQGIT